MSPESAFIVPNHLPQPSLFVPHGAPTFALRPGAAGAALARIATTLSPPRAIIMISAHWSTPVPTVGLADRPQTIHDYWGLPRELYSIVYPATGCKETAIEVRDRLSNAGFSTNLDEVRGLDHGAWIPLRLMFPNADVPVVPLSIQGHLGPTHHLAVGRVLAPMAQEGFLIIASGNLTHNLEDFQLAHMKGRQASAYVREFSDWIWHCLEACDLQALLDYRHQAPEAGRAHPTDEHLLPLYVAFGAAGSGSRVKRLYAGIDDYVLAMDTFAFYSR